MSSIYDHPEIYALEHSGLQPDVNFFVELAARFRPSEILEIACGDGRVTCPLAQKAAEWGGKVHGMDGNESMLTAARKRPFAELIEWQREDVRNLTIIESHDLIFSACASLSHLLTINDQLAVWRNAFCARSFSFSAVNG